jgi:hypothetical protein
MIARVPVWIVAQSPAVERIEVGRQVRSRPSYADPYLLQLLAGSGLQDLVSHRCLQHVEPVGIAGTCGNLGRDFWLVGLAKIKPGHVYDGPLTPWSREESVLFDAYSSPSDFFTYLITDFWEAPELRSVDHRIDDAGELFPLAESGYRRHVFTPSVDGDQVLDFKFGFNDEEAFGSSTSCRRPLCEIPHSFR